MKETIIKFIYFLGEHQLITFLLVLAIMVNIGILRGSIFVENRNKKNEKERGKACK